MANGGDNGTPPQPWWYDFSKIMILATLASSIISGVIGGCTGNRVGTISSQMNAVEQKQTENAAKLEQKIEVMDDKVEKVKSDAGKIKDDASKIKVAVEKK